MNSAYRRLALGLFAVFLLAGLPGWSQDWPQWGQNQQHTGVANASGQHARKLLDDVIYDPFVDAEKADPFSSDDLGVHYQVPLTDGDDVYMEFKTGAYTSRQTWNTQVWNEKKLHWRHGRLSEAWSFESDWKPVPFLSLVTFNGPFWEPVFHAVLVGNYVYIPGFGGSIYKAAKSDGHLVARINPFGSTLDPDTYVAGPLTADAKGNVYYNALKLDHDNPWDVNPPASYLVKVSPDNTAKTATIASLTPGAPGAGDLCRGIFRGADLPWPPSPDAVPATPRICGVQRVPANSAPAIAPDGTIYIVTTAHLWFFEGYLVAVNPDLTPKWNASLANRLTDGCNVTLPPNGTPGGCREGAHTGVDPWQNRNGSGFVLDDSTSVPVVLPDGSVLYGAKTFYPYGQGHLMKFSSSGQFLASYPFGWDDTPAVYPHDGTYSIITKDNHYSGGAYCNNISPFCPQDRTASNPASPEAFFITRLDSNLRPEWHFQSTNTQSCSRDSQGQVTCVSDHPAGFEWCVNAPAVDRKGNVFVNSEDGNLYAISPDGTLRDNLFLDLAIGAAYTPLSLDGEGKVLTQNDGHLFVVGEGEDDD